MPHSNGMGQPPSIENRTKNPKGLYSVKIKRLEMKVQALGLLVSVSLTHCCAYTPDLSTS